MLYFDEVKEVVSSFCKARLIPFDSVTLAISPEEVWSDLASWYLETNDRYAYDVSEMVRKYIAQEG